MQEREQIIAFLLHAVDKSNKQIEVLTAQLIDAQKQVKQLEAAMDVNTKQDAGVSKLPVVQPSILPANYSTEMVYQT